MITPQQQQQALSSLRSSSVSGAATPGSPNASSWYASLQQAAPQEAPASSPSGFHPLQGAFDAIGAEANSIGDGLKRNAAQQESAQSPAAKFGGEVATGADLAGAVTSLPFDAIGGALPRQLKQAIGTPVQAAADAITSSPEALHALNTINSLMDAHPHVAQLIGGLGTTAMNVAGGETGGEGAITVGGKAARAGASAIDTATSAAAEAKASLAALPETTSAAKNVRTIDQRVKELTKIEANSAPVRKVIAGASSKNIDLKNIVANTDLLQGAVDKTGTLRTTQPGGAVEQLNDFIQPQEDVISKTLQREGKTIPLAQLDTNISDAINSSPLKGGAKIRALNTAKQDISGYKLDAVDASGKPWVEGESKGEPHVPLATVHDAKVDKYSNIDYSNPESSRADKIIARTLKDTVEKHTTSADAKALNAELAQHYSVLNYLEKLDGRKVDGSKLGKYFARTIGAVAGSHFGPLGTIIGAEGAGHIQGALMSTKFGPKIGSKLELSQAMKDAIEANQSASASPVMP